MTVLEIERRLSSLGFDPGPLDGIRGPRIIAGIRAFQDRFGLIVAGIVGPQTRTALRQADTPAKPRRPEPDKFAMAQACPSLGRRDHAAPPPNAGTLWLLDTARRIDQ